MEAIGMIETAGLIAAIEAADTMLKTAQVTLIDRSLVGSGIVTVTVTGDVGAVKAAVDAGAQTVQQFGVTTLLSQHVIPRPADTVDQLFASEPKSRTKVQEAPQTSLETIESEEAPMTEPVEHITPESEAVKEKTPINLEHFATLTVQELREIARGYDNLGLTDNALAMANRSTLLKRFKKLSS